MNKIIRIEFMALIKKRHFYIPLLVIMLLLGGYFHLQYNASNLSQFDGALNINMASEKQAIAKSKAHNQPVDEKLTQRYAIETKIKKAFTNKQWSKVAKSKLALLKLDAANNADDQAKISNDNAQQAKLAKLKFIEEHNVYPDMRGDGVSGVNYVSSVMNSLLPEIIIALMIFMLTADLTKKYQRNKNMDLILPIKTNHLDNYLLCSTFAAGVLVYGAVLVIAFGLGTIFFGPGHLAYPEVLQNTVAYTAIPIWKVIVEGGVLQLLGIIGFLLFAQVIGSIFKHQLLTIMVTLLVTMAQIAAPIILPVLDPILKWVPGVYLQGGLIVNQHVAKEALNPAVNFSNGCLVTLAYIVLLYTIRTAQNHMQAKSAFTSG
ncbi:MAG: hypothetical protein LBT80_06555 [Lactobacillaceae bacterium]|nr:hypothetical protein [Lactobacillaceae bacterium]